MARPSTSTSSPNGANIRYVESTESPSNSNAARTPSPHNHSNPPRGPHRTRDTVVVTSQELRQLFDGLKDVGNLVRRQSKQIEEMASDLDFVKGEVLELKSQVHELNQTTEKEKEHSTHYGPIPKNVKDAVRLLHSQQDAENQFKGSEGIESTHNARVRGFLLSELMKEDIGHPKSTIQRGITKHYETKRQTFLDSLPERQESTEKKVQEKKLASRRRRLYMSRMKVYTEAEKQQWNKISPIVMSDEEDGEGIQKNSWVVRSPAWRSDVLNMLVKRLLARIEEKETEVSATKHPKNTRVSGPPSDREPPTSCPSWALKSHQVASSPSETPDQPENHRQELDEATGRQQTAKDKKRKKKSSSQRSLRKQLRAIAESDYQPKRYGAFSSEEDDDGENI